MHPRLIAVEGIDGAGKTTVINNLVKKYDTLKTISFPVDRSILDRQYDKNNLESIFNHHFLFMEDFVQNHQKLYNLLHDTDATTVLLDRYTPSNYVYMTADLLEYSLQNNKGVDWFKDTMNSLRDVIDPFYHELEMFELAIYLYKEPTSLKYECILALYDRIMDSAWIPIKGLEDNTQDQVEMILKKAGCIT